METESAPAMSMRSFTFDDLQDRSTDDTGFPISAHRCVPTTAVTADGLSGGPLPNYEDRERSYEPSESPKSLVAVAESSETQSPNGPALEADPSEEQSQLAGKQISCKIVAGSDGVLCFFLSQTAEDPLPDFWPVCSDTTVQDSRSSDPLSSTLFPFNFIAVIPKDSVARSQIFRCSGSNADQSLPEQYEHLRSLCTSPISSSLFACLICPPVVFDSDEEFLQHSQTVHGIPVPKGDIERGCVLQKHSSGFPLLSPLITCDFARHPTDLTQSGSVNTTDKDDYSDKMDEDNDLPVLKIQETPQSAILSVTLQDLENSTTNGRSSSSDGAAEEENGPEDRSSAVECPKCDVVLGSSKSLGGHMTMVHSRNSSKTLKCPKCNWHYKYQETLEIHMKEKHPESDETCPYCLTGQSHPRLARGEVYTCGYKPYRCEICDYSTTSKGNLTIHMQSDKHVKNIQDRQRNGTLETSLTGELPRSPSDDQPPIPRSSSIGNSKELHRCDVCNYETNLSRNLRIHMTSEKHQQNCNMYLQTRMQELNGNMAAMDPNVMMQLMVGGASLHQKLSHSSSMEDSDPFAKFPQNSDVFQCLICTKYLCNSVDELEKHATADRSSTMDPVAGSLVINGPQFVCRFCQYSTVLKANFQMHCTTGKHQQKLQLVAHIAEGTEEVEQRLKHLNPSNPIQVRCIACDFSTSSLHQLRYHVENNDQHEHNVAALLKLRDLQLGNANNANASAADNLHSTSSASIASVAAANSPARKLKLFCSICNFTSRSQSSIMQHVRTAPHYARWMQQASDSTDDKHSAYFITGEIDHSDLEDPEISTGRGTLFEEDTGQLGSDELSSSDDEESGILSSGTRKTDQQHSGSEDLSPSPGEERTRQMSLAFLCPLCQESHADKPSLETHLIGKHNVQTEALERIMLLVEGTSLFHQPSSQKNGSVTGHSDEEGFKPKSDASDIFRCQKCAVNFCDIDQLMQHQNLTGHLELKQTPRGPGYLCWKKGCNQYFRTVDSLQLHFREIHARKRLMPSNDLNCDSDDGMTVDENQHGNEGYDAEEEINQPALAESGYKDPNRKYKCHRCKVAFTKQIYLTAHNKTLQHRKGEKSTSSMEKYLDPSRPHKCEICKESFTQKNILIVHYNSVSHLHKLKKLRQENRLTEFGKNTSIIPAAGLEFIEGKVPAESESSIRRQTTSFEDNSKPFKCELCHVAYSNISNLDNHRRSVGHQSRLAKAQERTGVIMNPSKVERKNEQKSLEDALESRQPTRPTSEPPAFNDDKEVNRSTCSSPPPSSLRLPTRGKPGWGPMLESIGSEMVQLFLETQQRSNKHRNTNMDPVESEKSGSESSSDTECNQCHKVFTSPWILKVHRETAHADIVPMKVLETVASEYRKNFGEKVKTKTAQREPAETPTPKSSTPVEPPSKKMRQSSPAPNPASNYADLLAAQMQFLPLLYPGLTMGGLNMMNMQAAAMMNLQPPLVAPNGGFPFDQMGMPGMPDISKGSAAAANMQASAKMAELQNGQKRNRTRITDDQLQILRAHFDIRNPPSDDLLQKLCEQTGLELKVVKHWYRNTLFKERQRNKDSPYNFSVPPSSSTASFEQLEAEKETPKEVPRPATPPKPAPLVIPEIVVKSEPPVSSEPKEMKREESMESEDSRRDRRDAASNFSFSPIPFSSGNMSDHRNDDRQGGKRANRTRFTDFQIKSLQDYFDKNPYPKDDDLEDLSRALNLPPRVITVWFQNARQKARKSYENTTPPEEDPLQRGGSSSLTYQCKKCFKVFNKFYDFSRHQKSLCTGTSAGSSSASREVDDACSIASASSFSSSKVGSMKAKQEMSIPQPSLWDPNLSAMLGASSFMFPGLYPPNSPFGVLQMEAITQQGQNKSAVTSPLPGKRRVSSDDEADEEERSNKRVRTTIQPEQLDYLYQQYKIDSNPSRKQLEVIADKTGLKKRVVQVWYQNTRARERKGQLHLNQMTISKRCPVCRMHFKVRSALESHISLKHADVYCKGDISIEDLPDTDADSDNEPSKSMSPVSVIKTAPPASALSANPAMPDSMKRFYEEAMRKYIQGESKPNGSQSASGYSNGYPSTSKAAAPIPSRSEAPLDLSAPPHRNDSSMQEDSGDDRDESEEGSFERNGSLSASGMKPGKRFRTQMSNAQLKVMKRLFADYKTPTMGECELVGREIGLAKRVVQVWFQNARAKEKKNRLSGIEPERSATADHCPMCNVTYNAKLTIQDHLFTRGHIAALKRSEDCHEGPSSSAYISHLTSPTPDRERAPLASAKKPVENGDRKVLDSHRKMNEKAESSNSARNQMMGGMGDLNSMMMSDPNMLAYMYASMNPYAAMMNPAAAMMNPYAGLGGFYDPAVHGTALGMLQLPPGVGEQIAAKLSSSDSSSSQSVAFAQDGKRFSDLRDSISSADFACATSTQSEIGCICRKCQMVFPTEAACKNHQASVCYPGTRDVRSVIKLMQIHFHCSACEKQCATVSEFKSHCNSSSHLKNRQSHSGESLKRPVSNASSES